MRILTSALRVLALLALIAGGGLVYLNWQYGMPGNSYRGDLPPLTPEQTAIAANLNRHVTTIAARPHHTRDIKALAAAADYIERVLGDFGYSVASQSYRVDGVMVRNLEVRIPGRVKGAGTLILGAHYDSTDDGPGANDNGSGSAALLELARLLQGESQAADLRLVWFVNEEPPYFQGPDMGSVRYAKQVALAGERILGMLSLETMGYYRDDEGSQKYPHGIMRMFFPGAGDYIAFVGNHTSRALVRRTVGAFRAQAAFPSEGLALPTDIGWLEHVSEPLGYSDHWSFWQQNVPALMVTDTAFMRYPHYHKASDTVDKIDFARLARVTEGLVGTIKALANSHFAD